LSPTAVSVSSNGFFASVWHDGFVSYISLKTLEIIKTIPVSTRVLDLVDAGNGYIHAFPQQDQWEQIRTLNIATGEETLSVSIIRAGTVARLHPTQNAIYGADNGLSPSDIEKYDVSTGTAQYLYDSPYHGDYAMCGNLWISEDGLRIFTRCGSVFRSANDPQTDMTYNGALENLNHVQNLASSVETSEVAAIPGVAYNTQKDADTVVQLFNYEFLTTKTSLRLPQFETSSGAANSHGRFIFYSADGSRLFVVVQADAAAGLLNDTGIAVF